jgi:hypothetical protein
VAADSDSLEDATDDVFPERVEITVVISEDADAILGARLAEDLPEKAGDLTLTDPIELPEAAEDRYILVDDEWIGVEGTEGLKLSVARNGRGARWTRAAKHEKGARVEIGVTFRRVVEVPATGENISEVGRLPSGREAAAGDPLARGARGDLARRGFSLLEVLIAMLIPRWGREHPPSSPRRRHRQSRIGRARRSSPSESSPS